VQICALSSTRKNDPHSTSTSWPQIGDGPVHTTVDSFCTLHQMHRASAFSMSGRHRDLITTCNNSACTRRGSPAVNFAELPEHVQLQKWEGCNTKMYLLYTHYQREVTVVTGPVGAASLVRISHSSAGLSRARSFTRAGRSHLAIPLIFR